MPQALVVGNSDTPERHAQSRVPLGNAIEGEIGKPEQERRRHSPA